MASRKATARKLTPTNRKMAVLKQVADKSLSPSRALQLLGSGGTRTRKLRGVTATKVEIAAFATYMKDGDFRAFAGTIGSDTTSAQTSMGRIARATFEQEVEE